MSANQRKTHEQFIEELQTINPNVEVLGKYTNSKTGIEVRCRKCGHIWSPVPYTLLRKGGCPKCAQKRIGLNNRKTHEQFIEELQTINPNVEVLGKYTNSKTGIEVRCRKCGHIWSPVPFSLLRKEGCPKCAQKTRTLKRTKTKEQFICELQKTNPNIEVIGDYLGSREQIEVRCKVCGHIWNPQASSILHAVGCPQCAGNAKISPDAFVKAMKKINPDIEIIGSFEGMHTHVRVKCRKCGAPWDAPPISIFYNGAGCPRCCHTGTSFFEQVIFLVLQRLCTEKVVSRDKTAIGMELDIYIPHKKFAVEYGSWYWHKERKEKDLEKVRLCKKKDITLIEIIDSLKGEKTDLESYPEFWLYSEDICLQKSEQTQIQVLSKICKIIDAQFNLSKTEIAEIRSIARKSTGMRTTEQLAKELQKIGSKIRVIGEYTGYNSQIESECTVCGYQWSPYVSNLMQGCGCPSCNKKARLTTEEFREKLKQINPDIILLGEFTNTKDPVTVKCKNCNNIWDSIPSNLLRGRGCSKCKGGIKLSTQEFSERMKKINPDIEIIGEYTNSRSKIDVKCRKCLKEWSAPASSLLRGLKCSCSRPPRGHNFKRVICVETGIVYDSISAARTATGIGHIASCVTGKRKKAGGYHWRYSDPEDFKR